MQIIVLGTHRSGTSLVTRLINMMGAYFAVGDSALGANEENPKGFWERWDVIAANDAILQHYGCAWDRLGAWRFVDEVPSKDKAALQSVSDDIQKIVLELDAHRPWVIKDPRMCLTYPYWKPHLEVPVIVAVYRDPLEIARSLKTRNEFSFSHSMALWEYYATGILNAARKAPVLWVSHQDMLTNPVETVATLFEGLESHDVKGLRLPTEKEITSFIDPTLHRSKTGKQADLDQIVTPYQRALMQRVSGQESLPANLSQPTELAQDLMMSLQQYRQLQQHMEEQHQRYADLEQRYHEVEAQGETHQQSIEAIHAQYSAQLQTERDEIAYLKNSESWKIGHNIVRLLRKFSFSRSNASS